MDKNLNEKFNLPTTTDGSSFDIKVPMKPDDEASSDFNYVRENLYAINEVAMEAIEELKDVAKSSQHPRAYEVLATLIGRSIEANKSFYDLRKQRKDLEFDPATPTSITNNHLNITTNELNKLLSNSRKDSDPDLP